MLPHQVHFTIDVIQVIFAATVVLGDHGRTSAKPAEGFAEWEMIIEGQIAKLHNAFKEANGRTFPTWTDVLEVVRKLGYRKTLPSELCLGDKVQDWTESPDAPSGV